MTPDQFTLLIETIKDAAFGLYICILISVFARVAFNR